MKFGPGALRYTLALLVVIHHSFPLRLRAFAVFAFFTLSGYWITRMWFGRYGRTRQPYVTFMVSRWWRLAPVFLLCLLLAWLAAQVNPQAVQPPAQGLAWYLRQLPIVGSSFAGRILPPTWSLDVEMQFYLVAPLLILMIGRWPHYALTGGVVCATGVTGYYFMAGGTAEAPVLWPFLAFFVLGMVIALQNTAPSRLWIGTGLALMVVGTLILACWPATAAHLFARGRDLIDPGTVAAKVVMLWQVAGVFLFAPFIAWNVRQPSSLSDSRLGAMAYPLYLFHWIPRDFYYAFSLDGGLLRLLALVANIACAILGAYLINRLFDEPLDRPRQAWAKSRIKPKLGDANL